MMDNCVLSAAVLLAKLKIRYTKQYLEDNILSHPEHPSLLCISDTLEKYNIETLAVKVDGEKLQELPLPCIVQLSDSGGMFHVLTEFSDKGAVYFDDKGKAVSFIKEEFLKRWTGVCLLVESNELSKEPGIDKSITLKRTMGALKWTIAILLVMWGMINVDDDFMISSYDNILVLLYVTLKFAGLFMGSLLLWYEVDKYNPTLQNFCSGGKKVNCDSVLGSKYAKVFNGQLTLGLLGFSYFFGTLAFLILSDLSVSLALLGYLSLASLPIVAISAYYQGWVIKQWCKFCIIVQLVLLSETAVAFFGGFGTSFSDISSPLLLLALMLLPIPVWKWLKPLLEGQKEVNLYKRGLKKIKNNPDVLHGLLSKTRKIENKTDGLGIFFIKEQAKYNVVKVCNPYCAPCAKAHPVLEELVQASKINLQILFTVRAENDIKAKPVSHFLAIDAQGDKKKTQHALDDWYMADKKDYELFSKKYPMNGELESQGDKIEAMRQWCDMEKITHTPTIFINGYELPKEYSVEDLKEVLR